MATTSYLPLTLGQSVLGRSIESEEDAPEVIRVHGQCWRLVTDPQIAVTERQLRDWAAQDAQAKADSARDAAVEAAGTATEAAIEAAEEALGEMVADKSNVFIQQVAPGPEWRKAGVLWIDTGVVTVDGEQLPGNTPKVWDATATDWVAINDAQAVQAAAAAAAAKATADAAATAAGEAMAEARYAPRIADRAPTSADGVDKPVGAGWWQYGQTTNHQGVTDDRLIQAWQWDGSRWQRLNLDTTMLPSVAIGTGTFGDLSGDRLDVTGTLTARVVEALDQSLRNLIVTEDTILNRATVIQEIVSPVVTAARGYFEEIILGTGANVIPNGDLLVFDRDEDGEPLDTLRGWDSHWWTNTPLAEEIGYARSITRAGRVNGLSKSFTVEPGETYYVSVWARGDRAGKRFYVQVNTNGDSNPYAISDETTPDQEWARFEGQVTIPEDATTAHLNIYLNHGNGTTTTGYQWFTGFEMRRTTGGHMVAPGGITARNIVLTGNPDDPDEAALAASLAEIIKLRVGHLIVEEQADIEGARLIGETFADTLTVEDKIIGEDGIFRGTVDFANINVTGELLAQMIMAATGLIAGDPGGERLEITGQGLVLHGIGPDGEYEMVRLGPSGENLLTIGDTTVSTESVSAPQGAFEELSVGGESLEDLLWSMPRGRVAQNRYTEWSDYSDARQARLHVSFDYVPGRAYRVVMAPFFLETLTGSAEVEYRLVGKWDERSTSWNDSEFAWARTDLDRSRVLTVPGLEGDWRWSSSTAREAHVTLMVWARYGNPVRMIQNSNYPAVLSVDDVGPAMDYMGAYWTSGNRGSGDNETPPEPEPTVRRHSRTWDALSYGGDTTSGGDVYQGTWPGVGNRWGGWNFPASMRDALAGASRITMFRVYLYSTHWYWGSGGTAVLRPNDGTGKGTIGSRQVTSTDWPRNAGRWVSLPASWMPSFINGTYKGVSVRADSSNLIYYGQFRGSATRFRVNWETRE